MPDRGVTRVPLTWRLMPPIGRTRIPIIPDNDMMVPPIKIAVQPHANRKADAESDKGGAIRSLIIDLVRLVDRHINHLRVSRNNFNVAAVINHLLLRRGLQVADVVSRRAQALDGIHHVRLLIEKGLSQLSRPIQIIIHPFQHIWVSGQRLDAGVPGLLVNLIGVAAAADITVGQHDLGGQGGRRQDLGNQRVGIKGNRPQQLIELRRGKRLIGGHGRRNRHLGPHGYGGASEHTEENSDVKQGLHPGWKNLIIVINRRRHRLIDYTTKSK